jgi:spore coat protein SA
MSFAYQKLDHFIDKNDKSIPNHFDYKISWWQNFKIEKKRFNPVRNFVIRRYLSKADKIFAVSGALRDALIQNSIKNVSIVHNGIDVESFQKPFDEKSFRENLGLSNIPVVLFMGRLTPPKGSWVLFEAMSEVTRILPGAKLLAVGTPLDEWMKNALHRLNIYDSVMLLPAVPYEEIPKYYAGADVVAVPSICLDCFPTANLEAMAAGKPVVATCFGGSREAVEDTVTGYIVNPLNTDALAQKILFLLQNPEEAKAMGGRGYSRALAHFTAGDMVETYCSYYEL